MYYELYIDVFFLVNFMMDIFILLIAKNILKCQTSLGSVCSGATVGALLICMVVILPTLGGFIEFVIVHGMVVVLMTRIGLRIRFHKGFFKAYIVVYISAFLVGGIFTCLKQYVREGSMFWGIAFISFLLAQVIFRFLVSVNKTKEVQCEVLLVNGENQIKVKAIIDTGNRLKDSITGKPVSIISKETAKELWKEIPEEGIRYIPYCTLEGKGGVLPILTLEKMCLFLEEEVWVLKTSIAVCEDKIGTGEYEMILNPNVR